MTKATTYEEFVEALNAAIINATHDIAWQHEILKAKHRKVLEDITDDIPYPWYTK